MTLIWTRRTFMGALVAAGGLMASCGRSPRQQGDARQGANQAAAGADASAAPRGVAMTVYRDPSCGCCEAWAKIAEKAGYRIELIDHLNMPAVKRRHGVPQELASCHTAVVQGYVIEGHVPLGDVDHLLDERPSRVSGLAVPGMPRGSPGMEMPDGTRDAFAVMAFNAAGKSSLFHS